MNKTIITKLLLSIMLFTYVSVEPTGASFSDREINTNNTITSGWWKEPEVTITVPVGGEIYSLGDTVPIEWEVTLADPTSDYIADVYISKDSGANYDQIANDLDNETSFDWEIPNDPSYKTTHMMVKVIIEDDHNLIGQDESEEFDPIDIELREEEKQEQPKEELSKEEIEQEASIPTEGGEVLEEQPEETLPVEETTTTEDFSIEEPIEIEEGETETEIGDSIETEEVFIEENSEENNVEEEQVIEEEITNEEEHEEDTEDKEEDESTDKEEEDASTEKNSSTEEKEDTIE